MKRFLLSSIAGIAAAVMAHAAAAQTEIQWWHAMGGELGEKLNAARRRLQQVAEGLQGRPGLQGHLYRDADRGDRGVPRQAAARTSCRSSRSAPPP